MFLQDNGANSERPVAFQNSFAVSRPEARNTLLYRFQNVGWWNIGET
jgi:hypothetical protein